MGVFFAEHSVRCGLRSGVVIAADDSCCGNRWPMNSTSVCCELSGPIRAPGNSTHCCEDRRGRRREAYDNRTHVGSLKSSLGLHCEDFAM